MKTPEELDKIIEFVKTDPPEYGKEPITRTKLACNHEHVEYGKHCKHGQLARSCNICELEKEIDDLKCCGNCRLFCDHNCPKKEYIDDEQIEYQEPNSVCAKWQSDGLTRKDRE